MPDFTDEELTAERNRAERLAQLCHEHGHTDGFTANRAVLAAITAEQVKRTQGR